jgi:hypothetical protein
VEFDYDKVMVGGRGISDMGTARITSSDFHWHFLTEEGRRVGQGLREPGSADGMCFEVCLYTRMQEFKNQIHRILSLHTSLFVTLQSVKLEVNSRGHQVMNNQSMR